MKTNTQKKLPTSVPVLVIGIVLLLSLTFAAIYLVSEPVSRWFSVSNFNASSNVYFEDVSDMSPYKTEYGIKASLDSSAPNYIGNLRADVEYSGCGVGLIRVRVAEEWSITSSGVRTVMPYTIHMPYEFTAYSAESGNQSAWFDNRETDYCFYYATPVRVASENNVKTVQLITGFNADDIDLGAVAAGTDLHVMVEADVVQVNRYPQYWGLNALPWAGGISAEQTELA